MKFEITSSSGARKLVDGYILDAPEKAIENVMAHINDEIVRRASFGDTSYVTYSNFELMETGIRNYGKAVREIVFPPVVEALRSAGYTVTAVEECFGDGYSNVYISW